MPHDPVLTSSQQIYIFELDDTILSCNSFPIWAMRMLRGQVPQAGRMRRAATALAVGQLLLQRKLGLLRHAVLKQRLQDIWRRATAGDDGAHATTFAEALEQRVRPNMAGVLGQVRAGEIDAVLATAAAGEYAHAVARRLGFDAVLASDDGIDNVGPEKCRRVLAFLAERNWSSRTKVLFTDHLDDLPLMRVSDLVCWFGPDSEQAGVARQLVGVKVVASRDLDGAGVVAAASGFGPLRPPAEADAA